MRDTLRVLRILGVALIVLGAADLIDQVVINPQFGVGGIGPQAPRSLLHVWEMNLPATLGWIVIVATGLYLVFGGKRLARFLSRNETKLCVHCGYRLDGLQSARCPECGASTLKKAD